MCVCVCILHGLPQWLRSKESGCSAVATRDSVLSLAWEDPPEQDMATNSSIHAWEIPWTEEPGRCSPWDHKDLDTTEATSHTHTHTNISYIIYVIYYRCYIINTF